ncbi:hypothetical protein RYX36_015112, partial [Vicia faba]
DIYIGALSENKPHGTRKYFWSDACMYEGQCRKGKTFGIPILHSPIYPFSRPSGGTYEGELKSRRIEGFNSFIEVDGDMYRGIWFTDQKNIFSEKRYDN